MPSEGEGEGGTQNAQRTNTCIRIPHLMVGIPGRPASQSLDGLLDDGPDDDGGTLP